MLEADIFQVQGRGKGFGVLALPDVKKSREPICDGEENGCAFVWSVDIKAEQN
jgi:hypothetical protein